MITRFRICVAILSLIAFLGCDTFDVPADYRDEIIRQNLKFADASATALTPTSFVAPDGSPSSAQRPTSGLTVDAAVEFALKNNKELMASRQETDIAAGQILEAYSLALPNITLTGSYMDLNRAPAIDFNGGSMPAGMKVIRSIDATIQQPLWRGGAADAALQAAQLYSLLTDETCRSKTLDIIYETRKAYDDALLAAQLVDVAIAAHQSAIAQRTQIEQKYNQGIATEFALLRARVGESNHAAQRIQAENNLQIARSRLKNLIGLDVLPVLSDALTFDPIQPELERAVRAAAEKSPDLLRAAIAVHLQEKAVAAARSRYYPMVDGVIKQQWGRPDPLVSTRDTWEDAFTAGIVVQWSLFDGLSREGKLRKERAALRQRLFQLDHARESIHLAIEQSILSIRNAEQFVESQNQDRKSVV